jgi:hypothetical protein
MTPNEPDTARLLGLAAVGLERAELVKETAENQITTLEEWRKGLDSKARLTHKQRQQLADGALALRDLNAQRLRQLAATGQNLKAVTDAVASSDERRAALNAPSHAATLKTQAATLEAASADARLAALVIEVCADIDRRLATPEDA